MAGGALGLALLSGSAGAGPVPAPPTPADQPPAPLDLSIRSRALGVETGAPTLDTLGLGPAKAPTGAGSTRAPSTTTEIGRGVYLTVSPTCYPGEDNLFPARRSIRPSPRSVSAPS